VARWLAGLSLLLLAVAIRAQPAVDWSQAQPVDVLMLDNRFVPDRLTLRHDVPYRLHLANHGKDLHEFTAPEFLAAAVLRDPTVLANGHDIVVQPGSAVQVLLMPIKAGTFRLTCADHDWDGMVGEIIVE
jgi:uncharacterized cupredoxin-like copper-binding protein